MINHTVLQGRLTRDVELKTLQSGTQLANFCVVWDEKRGDRENVLFLNCTAFGKTAELLDKYFHKGKELVVEAQLQTDKYTDKNGNERTATNAIVNRVHFVGSKNDGGKSFEAEEDIPF